MSPDQKKRLEILCAKGGIRGSCSAYESNKNEAKKDMEYHLSCLTKQSGNSARSAMLQALKNADDVIRRQDELICLLTEADNG